MSRSAFDSSNVQEQFAKSKHSLEQKLRNKIWRCLEVQKLHDLHTNLARLSFALYFYEGTFGVWKFLMELSFVF